MGFKETITNVRNANTNKAELDKTKKVNRLAKGGLIGLGLGFIAQGIYIHKTRKKLMIKEVPNEVTDADIDKLGEKLAKVEEKFKKLTSSTKEKVDEFAEVTKEATEDIFQNPIDEADYQEVIFDDFHEEESLEESSEEEPEA